MIWPRKSKDKDKDKDKFDMTFKLDYTKTISPLIKWQNLSYLKFFNKLHIYEYDGVEPEVMIVMLLRMNGLSKVKLEYQGIVIIRAQVLIEKICCYVLPVCDLSAL